MDATQKKEYDQYLESLRVSESAIETAKYEAKEEGREEGISEKNIQVMVNAYKEGLEIPTISKIVAVSEEEVKRVLKDKGLL